MQTPGQIFTNLLNLVFNFILASLQPLYTLYSTPSP